MFHVRKWKQTVQQLHLQVSKEHQKKKNILFCSLKTGLTRWCSGSQCLHTAGSNRRPCLCVCFCVDSCSQYSGFSPEAANWKWFGGNTLVFFFLGYLYTSGKLILLTLYWFISVFRVCVHSWVFLPVNYTIISSCRAYSITCCASSVEGIVTSSARCCWPLKE